LEVKEQCVKNKKIPTNQIDDEKVKNAVKKLGVQPLAGIDELNFFFEDNSVQHFKNP
jgi:nascent polypeptide-associated complex subunit beta